MAAHNATDITTNLRIEFLPNDRGRSVAGSSYRCAKPVPNACAPASGRILGAGRGDLNIA